MADTAHELTDDKLEQMERHLSAIYSRAGKEIQKTADQYFDKFKALDAKKRKLVDSGKLSMEDYKRWRQNKILYGQRYSDMQEQVAAQLLNVNKTAVAYINGELPEIYALNYNALEEVVDGVGGYSFTLTDAGTIRHLATTDSSLLPFKEIDPEKDIPWNMKKINTEVLQGIIQGDSIPKIAARIGNVQAMNEHAAVRTARTIVTEAENKGRLDSYEKAQSDGIILQKEWISSDQPGRTRDWHMPGAFENLIVDIDKPFVNGIGPIRFPGDHTAHGANVYNCRCTMGAVVKGFKKVVKEVKKTAADYIDKIRKSEIFDGIATEKKAAILNALKGGDPEVVKMISETVDKCSVDWLLDDSGTSHYTFRTGNITMYGEDTDEHLARVFWHEYGHFIDDEDVSKTGVKFVEKLTSRSGKVSTFEWNGTTYVAKYTGYDDAAVKDVNNFLEKVGLSDRYYMKPAEDEYSRPWMVRLSDGKFLDQSEDVEDMFTLEKALTGEFDKISGRDKVNSFWTDRGLPAEIKWDDYFETYETPKRHIVRTREKYKGAEEAYQKANEERYDLLDAFWETHDREKLEDELAEMVEKTERSEMLLGAVSDTFDESAGGMFFSVMTLGGHSPDYYQSQRGGIGEGSANVFQCLANMDEVEIKGFETICPNMFKVYKEAITYGRK